MIQSHRPTDSPPSCSSRQRWPTGRRPGRFKSDGAAGAGARVELLDLREGGSASSSGLYIGLEQQLRLLGEEVVRVAERFARDPALHRQGECEDAAERVVTAGR
jgi:hypothetical protein